MSSYSLVEHLQYSIELYQGDIETALAPVFQSPLARTYGCTVLPYRTYIRTYIYRPIVPNVVMVVQ